jgi:hypothetical protein
LTPSGHSDTKGVHAEAIISRGSIPRAGGVELQTTLDEPIDQHASGREMDPVRTGWWFLGMSATPQYFDE